jgi:NDP-sugar pyrophosphorylase family protein
MILAAGLGTRLGTYGAGTPKVLIEVGGRSLLDRHLDYLEAAGISRVVINVHHLADQIEGAVASRRGALQVLCVREERLLGTAGGVRNVLDHLLPGPFVVVYGDIVVREPIAEIIAAHRRRRPIATLAVHSADDSFGKGTVEVDDADRVTRFVEKQGSHAGPVLINSGLYVLEGELMQRVEPGIVCDFGHDVFPAAVGEGVAMMAFRLREPIIDIGSPEGLQLARASTK